jgi:glycosyl-4,4'-diaponeurosporenoate acyltransferase
MPVLLRLLLISVAWAAIQVLTGFVTHHLPRRVFERDSPLYRTRRWEVGGAVYERLFRIRRWKDRLPEAGALFEGGVSKRNLASRSPEGLRLRVAETRRAELTHWLAVVLSLSFFAWNPPTIAVWMPIIGFVANAPFILVQRYVRPRLIALLDRGRRERPH